MARTDLTHDQARRFRRFGRRHALGLLGAAAAGAGLAPSLLAIAREQGAPEPLTGALAESTVDRLTLTPSGSWDSFADYLVDAHDGWEVERYYRGRLEAALPASERDLAYQYTNAVDQARGAVEEADTLRIIDAIARHFPEQAVAMRIVAEHVLDANGFHDVECEHLVKPWQPMRWTAAWGLVPDGGPAAA